MKVSSLDFVCPICKAQPHEECEMTVGLARFGSHLERKWLAQEFDRSLAIAEEPLEPVQ